MYAREGAVPEQNMAARVNCTILTESSFSFPPQLPVEEREVQVSEISPDPGPDLRWNLPVTELHILTL